MTTMQTPATAVLDPLGRTATDVPRTKTAPVLVASDGGSAGEAAVRFAATLARREGLELDVVTIEPGVRGDVTGFCLQSDSMDWPAEPGMTRLARVREQLGHDGVDHPCPLHVEFGRVAPAIARIATTTGARMVVIGLSEHPAALRLFTGDTPARVLRQCDVPVVAVEASATALPHRAVVGVDFGDASRRAAVAAASLLETPGELRLVHVRGADETPTPRGGFQVAYEVGVRAELDRLAADLRRPGLTVTTTIVAGRVAEVLLAEAKSCGAELVAVGSHGPTVLSRMLIGGVPTQLLRAADTSVLVAPPIAVRAQFGEWG